MKKDLFVYFLSGLFLCVGLISCDKDETPDDLPLSSRSFYVLTRGNWGQNNAALGYYDAESEEYTPDYYAQQNDDKLGELAEDILIYGGKTYITVPGSNSLIVTDPDAKKKAVIKPDATEPLEPKTLMPYRNYVFVSYYKGHSVAVLDTTTLSVTKIIEVGRYPEQMAISGNKLFVTNSGGLDYDNGIGYAKTVSVIDLLSLEKEPQDIELNVVNPTKIIANSQGDLFVISMGDYQEIPNTLQKITKKDDAYDVKTIGNATVMTLVNNTLYTIYSQLEWNPVTEQNTTTAEYVKYNAITGEKEGTYLNNPGIPNPYSLDIDPISGFIYINDQNWTVTNDLYVFDANGNKRGTLNTKGFDVAKVLFHP